MTDIEQEHNQLSDAIWKRHNEEREYWINDMLNGWTTKSMHICEIEAGDGVFHTLLADTEDPKSPSAILLHTDTKAMDVESSHKYVILEKGVIEAIRTLFP